MRDIHQVLVPGVAEILDSLNAGVYVADTDRTIVFWNRRAEQITGHKAKDVVGRRCSDGVLSHQDKDGRPLCSTGLCPLYRSMLTSRPSEEPILVYANTASGERIPLSTSVAPVHDQDGELIGGVEVFRDERQSMQQMKLARAVQQQMLTSVFPTDDRISFSVEYAPMETIGGDFYHVARLSDDVFSLLLVDVAGHGTSAALYTALLHSLIGECASEKGDPARFMSALNVRLSSRAQGVGLVTGVCVNLHAAARTAAYCCAGHPAALLQPPGGGQIRMLEGSDYPLGIDEDAEYTSTEFSVERGGRLLVYSDGAIEVETGDGRRLGVEGLKSLLSELPPAAADHRLGELYASVLQRCVTPAPKDDVTLLSCILL